MEASTADELTSGASGGLNGDSGDQAGKDRLTPTKKKRRHPVARVKGCWGADEDERLVRCGVDSTHCLWGRAVCCTARQVLLPEHVWVG